MSTLDFTTTVSGGLRTVTINGAIYTYTAREPKPGQDRFIYTIPGGGEYSHPSAEGCLLMILKHAAGGH